jgi:hypothetical protein
LKHHHCGAFGEWVRDLAHWQAFGTMTFEREVSVWSAARSFEDFVVRQIPWVKCFYSVERHRVHGGHLHALFAECGELEWRPGARERMLVASMNDVDVWREWKWRYGRNSIEMPRRGDDTARYCAKYLTKEAAQWNHNLAVQFEKRETEIERAAQWVFPGATVLA